jgi:hypothetical protein
LEGDMPPIDLAKQALAGARHASAQGAI